MIYDIGIIGGGVAGSFAALRLSEKYKKKKVILFEFGPPPPNHVRKDPFKAKKRRRQLEGWMGCFPTGDGKIYVDDYQKILDFGIDGRTVKAMNKWFFNHLNEDFSSKIIKPKNPNVNVLKKIKELGFNLDIHNYQQWNPETIHHFSRMIAEKIEKTGNVEFSFDNEVSSIIKKGNNFLVFSSSGDFECKKIILCVGRSGWRWVADLYKSFGIPVIDNTATYGFKIELPANQLREFNKSHCSLTKEGLRIGPLSWFGSVVQEDHADLTTAAFRSNETRWKTDRVFFSVLKDIEFKNAGIYQTDRIAKLAFLLAGDRVGRERIKAFFKGESQLSLIKEYDWLPETLKEVEPLFPNLISRGYYHVPDICTLSSKIRISSNLETEVEGLYVAGESVGISGITSAGILGGVAADSAAK